MPVILLNIDAPDSQREIACDVERSGLRLSRRFVVSFVEMLGQEARSYLLRKAGHTPIDPAGGDVHRHLRHWSLIHLGFVADYRDGAITRMRSMGPIRKTRWRASLTGGRRRSEIRSATDLRWSSTHLAATSC